MAGSSVRSNQSEGRNGMGWGLFGGRGSSMASNTGTWHPTILGLIILVILEMFAYGALRYAFRSVHGG